MTVEVFEDLEQGTDEWRQVRLGIPTASMFFSVLSKGAGGEGEAKSRRTYMLKLIGERFTGEPADNYQNDDMERGHEMEPQARAMYAFSQDEPIRRVGFLRNTFGGFLVGASPDSLVGTCGALEIKSKKPHLHLETHLNAKVPSIHVPQCQGVLMVGELDWIDFMSYWPKMDPFVMRAHRDENYIRMMRGELVQFCEDMARVEEVLRKGRIEHPVLTSTPRKNPFSSSF